MLSFCAVVNCGNKAAKTKDIRYFRLPAERNFGPDKLRELSRSRRQKWIQALHRDGLTASKLKYARICSMHFHSGQPAALNDVNNPDWVPSVRMGYRTQQQASGVTRYERTKHRHERIKKVEDQYPVIETPAEESTNTSVPPTYEELQTALEKANKKIKDLERELMHYKLEEQHFIENEEDVAYFTGFPEYAYLKNVLSLVEPYLPESKKISKFHQLLMTLMKLRLDFHFTYLAKIFQCHRTTVSRTIEKVIEVMYYRLKCFIEWPSRENLLINMPASFKNSFGEKVTVIIDCFEIFIEKPSSLDSAARTWSNYKHHHTMKFLIGISPQGCIIFISSAYGGRASDKYLTEHSGFLDNLLPGDLVIADRGFAIDESVNLYLAEVKYPSFLKGRKQLNAIELEETRKLASIRINVERIIGQLKAKFNILKGVFPLLQLRKGDDEFAFIDKIITVCCSIINICPGIIPVDE